MDIPYNFPGESFYKITFNLLIEILAHYKSVSAILIERLNVSDSEKDSIIKQINELNIENKESILSALYEQYGETPDLENI